MQENPQRFRYSPNQNEANLKIAKAKQNITGSHWLYTAATKKIKIVEIDLAPQI